MIAQGRFLPLLRAEKSTGRYIHRQNWLALLTTKQHIRGGYLLPICQPWCQSLCYFVPKIAQICAKGRATQLFNATCMAVMSLNECLSATFLHGRKPGKKACFPMKTPCEG